WISKQGVKGLDVKLAERLAGENPDYHIEDLYTAIQEEDYPTWTLYVQIIPYEDYKTYKWDLFDVTKTVSKKDYPRIEVGKMVLNRNPENYFAEVEQAAFSPGNFVPGIEASPDKMLQGRIFSYGDAHRYRLGINHHQIPINKPKAELHNYHRNGYMRVDDNVGSAPNYEPNSYQGPVEDPLKEINPFEVSGEADSVANDREEHLTRAGDLYLLMNEEETTRLMENFVNHMKPVEKEEIKLRQMGHFYKAHPECGERIAEGLGLSVPESVK